MPQNFHSVLVALGDYCQIGITIQAERRIDELAIDPAASAARANPRADGRSHLGDSHRSVEGLLRAVR